MSETTAKMIWDFVIFACFIFDAIHIHRLEENEKALKQWIKFCYHVDLDKMTEFVESEKKDGNQ